MAVPLLTREQGWTCPNCDAQDVTVEARPHSRMHSCRGLRGLTAPMVPAGTRCKAEAVEWGDYERPKEQTVQRDGEGRPVSAVVVTRDEGQDTAVLAPCALGRLDDYR